MSTVSVTEWKHPTSVVNGVYLAATFVGLLTLVAFGAICHALWMRERSLTAITSVLFAVSTAALYAGFFHNGLLRSMGSTFVLEDEQVAKVRHCERELSVTSQEHQGGVLKLTTSEGRFCFIGKR